MIKKNDKEIVGVFKGTTEISAVYKGLTLVYQNAKTMIAEGVPPITVLKALEKVLLGYRVYGNSTQQTYTGKNLWNSTLIAGCMKFADGQYLNYPGYVCNATPIPVEAGQTYTISADNYDDPESTSTGYVFYNNGTFVSSLITTSLTVTIPSGVNQLYYDFRKQSSASSLSPSDITNVQFEKGSTATSYEPYVGGIKSPNPYYPQEIESVGDETINLCPKFCTVYPNDEAMSAVKFPVVAGSVYCIDFAGSSSAYKTIWLYDTNNNITKLVNYAYNGTSYNKMAVKPQQDGYLALGYMNSSAKVICAKGNYYSFTSAQQNNLNNNQITTGVSSGTIPYEPYGYKIPITVKGGKNIWDKASSVPGGTATIIESPDLLTSKTYTLSFYLSSDYSSKRQAYLFSLRRGGSGRANIYTNTTGVTAGKRYSYTFTNMDAVWMNNQDAYNGTIYDIMIEENNQATSYEPYIPPQTSNIYLNQPLRRIGSLTPQALPVGYTQLDYIESTGTQYLDTGIILTNEDFVTVKFSNSLNESYSVFGANDGTYRCQFFYNARSRYIRNFTTVNEHMLISGQVEYGVVQTYDLDLKNRQYKQGSGSWINDTNAYQGTPQLSTFLFAQNNSGEASGIGTMRIYEYSVSRNGVEIQHLVPAKNSSGVVGMYDTIGNTFLTNQGTGTFNSAQSTYYDYIDFETQKVYRNVGHIDLSDTTYTYQSQYTRFRSNTIPGLKVITGNWTYALMSDIYGNTLAQNFNIGAQGGALFVWDNRYTDPTALKTALAGHYLDFALGATTEESVTLPSITLNKGTNIVSVGTSLMPSYMWIKYKGKA